MKKILILGSEGFPGSDIIFQTDCLSKSKSIELLTGKIIF